MSKIEKPKYPVQMAVIGAAHGIRGEVKVKSFTADPFAFGEYGPLTTADGRRMTVAGVRQSGGAVIAKFAEVADRTAAEKLSGTALFVDRSALPEPDDEEEFYQADLVGLAARAPGGEAIGTVTAVHDFGAGDILELRLTAGGTAMIPFTRLAVPQIDMAGRTLTVDPVAAGLVEGEEPA
jgi:16S rRNA processing protein RimM